MAYRSAISATWPTVDWKRGLTAASVRRWLHGAFHAATTRPLLAELDDRMLADIGISRSQALTEADRAPWDLGPKPFQR